MNTVTGPPTSPLCKPPSRKGLNAFLYQSSAPIVPVLWNTYVTYLACVSTGEQQTWGREVSVDRLARRSLHPRFDVSIRDWAIRHLSDAMARERSRYAFLTTSC